jgi:hypothetical protein
MVAAHRAATTRGCKIAERPIIERPLQRAFAQALETMCRENPRKLFVAAIKDVE